MAGVLTEERKEKTQAQEGRPREDPMKKEAGVGVVCP